MNQQSIDAYDLPERVASYDADMEIMHPNRFKMVQIALEILPFPQAFSIRALDLGIGTGYFTEHLMRRYPDSHIIAIDGARAMVDLANARLGPLAEKVEMRIGDFRNLKNLVSGSETFDIVYSSYALHHLNSSDKESVVRQSLERLNQDGWFLNADIIVAETPQTEQRFQELRVRGIVERAQGRNPRFCDPKTVRTFLDDLEKRDGDQPQTLREDLEILKRAGIRNASAFWLEYREAVCGGQVNRKAQKIISP